MTDPKNSAASNTASGLQLLRPVTLWRGTGKRQASWLSLFFDLVFVLALGALAEELRAHPTLDGGVSFALLFVPIWFTWLSWAYFDDLFDNGDAIHRLAYLGAMGGSLLLGLHVPEAARGEVQVFAAVYAALRLGLAALYLRPLLQDRETRSITRTFFVGFLLGAALAGAASIVSQPFAIALFAAAVLVDIGTPMAAYWGLSDPPVHQSHLPERIGLFGIIALGEAIAGVRNGLDAAGRDDVLLASAGFVLACSVWWIAFARFDRHETERALRGEFRRTLRGFAYGYGHLAVFAAITLIGVGVHLVLGERVPVGGRLVMVGGILFLLGLSFAQVFGPVSISRSILVLRTLVVIALAIAASVNIASASALYLTSLLFVLLLATPLLAPQLVPGARLPDPRTEVGADETGAGD